jgi:hypothetical protein
MPWPLRPPLTGCGGCSSPCCPPPHAAFATRAAGAHNRDQASLPAPRPPTRNSGQLPVRR